MLFYNVIDGDQTVDGQEFNMYSEREQDGCLSFTCNVCKKEFECKVSIKSKLRALSSCK